MPTYPTIPLTVPTVGGSSGAWGTTLNAALLAIDSHNHLGVGSGGAQIVSAAININADLTFASYSATNLRSVTFASGQAVTGVRKLYVGADSELYWNNSAAGTAIQITDGTSLNVAGFIGGIGGDYTSVSAELNYDDSAARYTLRKGGGTTWARVAAGEVRIHEHASTTSIYVALASPAALASPYTVTFPAAVPAGKRMVQVSSAGVLTFENTGIAASTFTGLVTADAGVTAAADQHVTVSGTGRFKHGELVRAFNGTNGSGTNWAVNNNGYMLSSGAGTLIVHLPFDVGERVKSISFQIFGDGSADLTTNVWELSTAMAALSIGTDTTSNQAASWSTVTIDVTDSTVTSPGGIFLEFIASAANLRIGAIMATYDRP